MKKELTVRYKKSEKAKGKIEIDKELCKGCGYCTVTCPNGVISIGDEINGAGYFYAIVSQPLKCTGCAMCAEICPDIAITVWRTASPRERSQDKK